MSVSQADIYEAVNTTWDESGLDDLFKSFWSDSIDSSLYPTLHDQEAAPGQPFPYCVVEIALSSTISRMSGDGDTKREIREMEATFSIYAGEVEDDARSAKEIAGALAEEVMKIYGGHPTEKPDTLHLNYGQHVQTQYQTDYSSHMENDRYLWTIVEKIVVDVPVAI